MATETGRGRGAARTTRKGAERAPRASVVDIAAGATGVATADTRVNEI